MENYQLAFEFIDLTTSNYSFIREKYFKVKDVDFSQIVESAVDDKNMLTLRTKIEIKAN